MAVAPARRRPAIMAAVAVFALGTAGLPVPMAAADDASGENAKGAETAEPVYRVGPSDALTVDVRGEPEFSGRYIVRPDGRITLPVAGNVEVVGKTPPAIADRLTERLKEYIETPVVTVTVANATGTFDTRIRVIGDAIPPRSLPYREGLTALDLVTTLGGLPDTAAGDKAYILRETETGRERIPVRLDALGEQGRLSANIPLQPGDTVVIPEGFFTGDWQFNQFVTARTTFTDNEDLDPPGEEESALITEIGPGINLSADMARVQAALNASVRYERQSFNDTGNDLNADLSGTGTFEWVETTVFTDVSGSVSQQVLDTAGAESASGVNDANRELVQTYRVSPYVVERFGRTASFRARYSGAVNLFSDLGDGRDDARFNRDNDDTSDTISHRLSTSLSSGPRFSRWGWSVSASASEQNVLGSDDSGAGGPGTGDADEISRRDLLLSNQFAIVRNFVLIGDIGYQKLESEDEVDSFESVQWSAGARYTPSPDTSLFASIGRQDDDRTFTVEARHAISPRTSVSLTYDEEVASGQERLVADLPEDVDDIGDIQPGDIRFSIRDEITRTETVAARLNTRFDRNSIGLTATYRTEDEDAVNGDETEESYEVSVDYRRPLTRDVSLSLNGSYENVTFRNLTGAQGVSEIEDDNYDASIGLSYTGFERLSLNARYIHSRRESTQANDDFRENAVTLSGRLTF